MTTLVAPGDPGLSPIAMKKLPKEARLIMLDIIHHYWNGIDNNPEWNVKPSCASCTRRKESRTI
jgi:hypothetical protein